ncbi:MAG: hypothetical protein JXB34_11020 [Bacteroidales bacterium]|nr:hypothetical protein [Bacteroidales bacterium]
MEHMEIIHYGTEAFNSFENLSPIKKEEARKLCIDFCNKNDIKGGNSPLFFIIDSFYVFSPYNNPKIPEVSLTGIWVNAKTGEVKYIKNHQKIRPESQFGWRSRTGLQ